MPVQTCCILLLSTTSVVTLAIATNAYLLQHQRTSILLLSGEYCNLPTLNLSRFHTPGTPRVIYWKNNSEQERGANKAWFWIVSAAPCGDFENYFE